MQVTAALDAIEALLHGSSHPDFEGITRYGADTTAGGSSPPGIKVTHRSGSSTLIWVADAKPDGPPVTLPAEMPPPPQRVQRMVTFLVQLFDVARPAHFTAWKPCRYSGVHLSPAGLQITASDSTKIHLRITNASGASREPTEDPYPDYQFPELPA